jgi:hypothetical protein
MVLPGVSAGLALLVLMPLLGRGFVLNYDMVFAPDQALLPDSLGLGTALPRSVPADAVISFATALLPGDIVQKLILFLALFAGPLGAGRLVPTDSVAIKVVAAVTYGWSAYVAERLFMGHWPYLVAYACLPWVAAAGLAVRRGEPRATARLVLACAPAAITPTGGILVTVMAIVCAARLTVLPVALVLNAPWWIPSLLRSGAALSTPDSVAAFGARAESWATPVTSVLGLGGIWNSEVTPASRAMPLMPVLTLITVAVALWGLYTARWGRSLVVLGAVGVLISVLGVLPGGADVLKWTVAHVPGTGLLRDSQKWAAWWAVPLAVGFALGVQAAGRHLKSRAGLLTVAILLPVVSMPDLAWGGFGRLATVAYPQDWAEVRTLLAEDPRPGDVITMPFAAFRRFEWNGGRTQLDPAPRVLPRTTVIDDTVYVGGRPIPGEDTRAAEIRGRMSDLGGVGIGWILVEHGTPGQVVLPGGVTRVWQGEWLSLYRVGGIVSAAPAGPSRVAVLIGDAAALALIAGCLLWLVLPAGRFITARRSIPTEE